MRLPLILTYRKILLEAHGLIEAHPLVWAQKMPIFQANFLQPRILK